MSTSKVFQPFEIRGIEIRNRIAMSPMCMFIANNDGLPLPFHTVHYVSRAIGGVGLIIQEATAVLPEGRITNRDLGLWNEQQMEALKEIVNLCHQHGAKIIPQLAHAGRKSEVTDAIPVAPTSENWNHKYPVPKELSKDDINNIVEAFAQAAAWADMAGYDGVEIHAAHGYLIHEFLSPLSNKRTDEYGGSLHNRTRLLRDILHEVRHNLSDHKPVLVRLSASDYLDGGIDIDQTVAIVNEIKDNVDLIDVSSGGLLDVPINTYPGYQVGFAQTIKECCEIMTGAVGLISSYELAEEILCEGRADIVLLGRELLRHPYWVLDNARRLGQDIEYWPVSYGRAK